MTVTIAQINTAAKTVDALNSTNFQTMSVKEMAEWFGINRFADRKAAEKRCTAKLNEMIDAALTELDALEAAFAAQSATTEEKAPKARRSAAEGIAASWNDPEVAAKRMTRNSVVANGEEFKSVRAAFYALGLPDNKHIAFRMKLKAEGHAEINGIKFVIA